MEKKTHILIMITVLYRFFSPKLYELMSNFNKLPDFLEGEGTKNTLRKFVQLGIYIYIYPNCTNFRNVFLVPPPPKSGSLLKFDINSYILGANNNQYKTIIIIRTMCLFFQSLKRYNN